MVIVRDTEDVLSFLSSVEISHESYPLELKLLFFAENLKLENFKTEIPMFKMGEAIEYSYFVVETKQEVQLKTFEWWTEDACNETQLVTINSFNKKSQKWKFPLKIPQKFTNFHNCSFVVLTSMHRTYTLDNLIDLNENYFDDGKFGDRLAWRQVLDGLLMSIFAEKANYTAIQVLTKNDPGLQIYQVTEPYADKNLIHKGENTQPYYNVDEVMVIPISASYNNYEKMLFPFDKTTWVLLIVTFCIAIFLVWIIKLLSIEHQILIFKVRIQASFIDVLSIFFGVAQTRQSTTFVTRFIFLIFIFSCLIFRTAYQGKNVCFFTFDYFT
jgi:hypothetical protein